jgi:hypothetical protein
MYYTLANLLLPGGSVVAAEERSIFVTGYARLPSGIVAAEVSKVVGVGLEIDPESGEILDADCTLITTVARSFVRRILVGKSLSSDLKAIEAEIMQRYHGNAQRAIIAALRIAHEKFTTQQSPEAPSDT